MFTLYNLLIIKDVIVLIHLTKTSTLEESCDYFQDIIIPEKVKQEVIKYEYPKTIIIKELIAKNKKKSRLLKIKTI